VPAARNDRLSRSGGTAARILAQIARAHNGARSGRLASAHVPRTATRPEDGFLARTAGLTIGGVLGAVAGVRRGKAVHPHGAVYEATLAVSGAAAAPAASTLLSRPGEHRAITRFSRSLGLPRPMPDLLGLSLRVPDAYGRGRHQDLLLVTSVDLPVLHHLFLPAGDVQQRPYTSSLPYRAGRDLFLVGALPVPGSPRPAGGTELDRLRAAAATGRMSFELAVARLRGRFEPVATLRIGDPLPPELDALRFNPWNTGGGMTPAGWLNGARDLAYRLSQASWRRTRPGGAELQEAADRRMERLPPAR
jgi:hypothetical protein